ncbi:methyl-accepting chemotaxis protein [Vibrio sp. Of7-15]|uniref:methyl-accepting chemotaxis protein n=1 Tax=Vibrio sp. Of7-15 TaxID=2724879 RepID=UPI001EF2C18B|nr:PAS domain-containing methyl-accepting chemotaxis protein [Vibrio sp. Of7-15]MCG7495376.1 methyl-accepting chemotaxis protein [Vibrio sp. Of7-15]
MNNSSANEKERTYGERDNLISTTDPKSYITFSNDKFCEIAGYTQEELIGNPHNIVRHPDMPKQAFKNLWEVIKTGKTWMGPVKNYCKGNKEYYWVSAFVTPIVDVNGRTIEYQSVRTKPKREWVERAIEAYAALRQDKTPSRLRYPRFNLGLISSVLSALLVVFAGIHLAADMGAMSIMMLVASLLLLLSIFMQRSRLQQVQKTAKAGYDNPFMEFVYTSKLDDYSSIELAFIKKEAELRSVVARSIDTSTVVVNDAEKNLSDTQTMKDNLTNQVNETTQVATAVTELNHSIREVADSANASRELSTETNNISSQAQESVDKTIEVISQLNAELESSKVTIDELTSSTNQIESILGVIGSIADQTNLLALNAAIEAARAGEAGRGFAVVADEVRSLASKTQSSTEEIRSMIANLQSAASKATTTMESGSALSASCQEQAKETGDLLITMNEMTLKVSDASYQIASAVEEQADVTNLVNESLESMQEISRKNSELSDISVEKTNALVERVKNLRSLMVQFQR